MMFAVGGVPAVAVQVAVAAVSKPPPVGVTVMVTLSPPVKPVTCKIKHCRLLLH
jgi:hypothetical protein